MKSSSKNYRLVAVLAVLAISACSKGKPVAAAGAGGGAAGTGAGSSSATPQVVTKTTNNDNTQRAVLDSKGQATSYVTQFEVATDGLKADNNLTIAMATAQALNLRLVVRSLDANTMVQVTKDITGVELVITAKALADAKDIDAAVIKAMVDATSIAQSTLAVPVVAASGAQANSTPKTGMTIGDDSADTTLLTTDAPAGGGAAAGTGTATGTVAKAITTAGTYDITNFAPTAAGTYLVSVRLKGTVAGTATAVDVTTKIATLVVKDAATPPAKK